MPHVTLVWFRNDLRLDDQPALRAAAARGPVVPLFIHAPEEERPWEPGAASRWWLHGSLAALAGSLEKAGCPLLVRRGPSCPGGFAPASPPPPRDEERRSGRPAR